MIAPPFIISFLATGNLLKIKLGKILNFSNNAQNHSYSLQEVIIVIAGHYLPKFIKFTKSEICSSEICFKHLSK